MTYSYDEGQGGYGHGDAHEAGDAEDNAGACPPQTIWYRIYPEEDFGSLFANPPDNVIT